MQCSVCLRSFERSHSLRPDDHSQHFEHHQSRHSWQLARDEGCILCSTVWNEFSKKGVDIGDDAFPIIYRFGCDESLFPMQLEFSLKAGAKESVQTRTAVVLQIVNTPEEFAKLDMESPEIGSRSLVVNDHRYIVDAIGRVSGHPNQTRKLPMKLGLSEYDLYPLQDTTGSQKTLALAGAWLRDCRSNHGLCNTFKATSNFNKARLLDLKGDGDIVHLAVLRHNLAIAEHDYATLSHRWGLEKPLQLTKDTEEELSSGMPVTRLPPLFQDAVRITASLGIQFLWIDSLCIQQDSPEDWLEQANHMGAIYKCGSVNIAATAATSCSGNIFFQRDPAAVAPARISLSCKGHTEFGITREQTKDCLVVAPNTWEDIVEGSLLASRGWIFQERMLSPRILHFAADRVFWECHCSSASETIPSGRPFLGSWSSAKKFIGYSQSPALDLDLMDARAEDQKRKRRDAEDWQTDYILQQAITDLYGGWLDIVKNFSACDFTKPSDKLIALRGVATEMYNALNGRDLYLDGHWFSSLPYELLWVAGKEIGYKRFELYHAHRPKGSSLAPTWSWASVIGAVDPFWKHTYPLFRQEGFSGTLLIDMQRVRTASLPSAEVTTPISDTTGKTSEEPLRSRGLSRLKSRAKQILQSGKAGLVSSSKLMTSKSRVKPGRDSPRISVATLGVRSFFLEIAGHIHEAELNPLADPADINDMTFAKIKSWAMVFGHGRGEQLTFSGKSFTHGILFAADDGEDFHDRIVPAILDKDETRTKFFALPIWYRDGDGLEGILLEQVEGLEVEIDGAKVPRQGDYSDSLRSFVRVGKFGGQNLMDAEHGAIDLPSITERKREVIKLF